MEKVPYKEIEIDIWINEKICVKFIQEFTTLNHTNVKYIGYEVLTKDGEGDLSTRISLFFVKFWNEELEFPKQDYYQLNNAFL